MLLRQDQEALGNGSITYDDLAGQMRISMDQFPSAVKIDFSFLSLMILAIVAFIGPLDFWLINRVLGRPLLGWLTFPITIMAASAVLWMMAGSGSTVPVEHRIEVLDLNLTEKAGDEYVGRTTMLTTLYSRDAVRLDASLRPAQWLSMAESNHDTPFLASLAYPSQAFGGVRLATEQNEDNAYEVILPRGAAVPSLKGLPLPPRSSKSLVGQFEVGSPTPSNGQTAQRGVTRRPGSELLQDSVTNPLPVDLLDGRLIYQNWVYLLPTRFVAGSTIAKVDSLRQKNFRWLLSRQKALESSSENEAWRSGIPSTDRILEMMLYHEAAGGADYTSLHHRPLGHLDLSHVLDQDRCLLVGRVEQSICQFDLSDADDQSLPKMQTERTSIVRILLPANFNDEQ